MPYLVLALGLLIGAYALYRFFLNATIPQIKAFFLVALLFVLSVALFFMAITGRLAAALALLVAMFPVVWPLLRRKIPGAQDPSSPAAGAMTRREALEILDLEEGADEAAINEAYKRLMQKVHPDNKGSDWMAAKLNAARDLLLEKN